MQDQGCEHGAPSISSHMAWNDVRFPSLLTCLELPNASTNVTTMPLGGFIHGNSARAWSVMRTVSPIANLITDFSFSC
jgi:hypothetical protein